MANERLKSWTASILIHGLSAAALVFFAGHTPTPTPDKEPIGSLVINFDGDGSPAPGNGPGTSTIPKGEPDAKPEPNVKPEPEPEDPLLEQIKQIREQQKREREAAQTPPTPTPTPTPPPPPTPPQPSPQPTTLTTLEAFQKEHPRKQTPPTKPDKRSTQRTPRTQRTPANIKSTGIDVTKIIGKTPLGVQGGVGSGGNPNGGGPIAANYENRLKLLIQAQWQLLLDAEGRTLQPGISGEFRLNISNNGNISFGGWTRQPHNPLFESLLRRAIDAVGNKAGPRPAGTLPSIIFAIDADSRR
ncbi:MAG: procyclic acidic repetitive family protein [Puniceicoccales bacterium]|jgi:outer membrane biosynthesis protein TonB|nr:procyclic acidic repetitive family protein [Puniceicoccales bacterium]